MMLRPIYLYYAVMATSPLLNADAFTKSFGARPVSLPQSKGLQMGVLDNPASNIPQSASVSRFCKARELIKSLVEEEKCFSTEAGAMTFGEYCAVNVVYEDCFEPQPFVGKIVSRYGSQVQAVYTNQ
jgi:hypothetical protein